MGKLIDLTSKVNRAEEATIKVKNVNLKVKTDTYTFLKIGAIVEDNKGSDFKYLLECCNVLFSKEDMNKLKQLNLDIDSFTLVINTAIDLLMGNSEEDKKEGK